MKTLGVTSTDRRSALKIFGLGTFGLGASGLGERAFAGDANSAITRSAETFEGQRRADLGNGTFLNPILAGDHPDPAILKDGSAVNAKSCTLLAIKCHCFLCPAWYGIMVDGGSFHFLLAKFFMSSLALNVSGSTSSRFCSTPLASSI